MTHIRQATRLTDIKKQERKELALAIVGGIIATPICYVIIFIAFAMV